MVYNHAGPKANGEFWTMARGQVEERGKIMDRSLYSPVRRWILFLLSVLLGRRWTMKDGSTVWSNSPDEVDHTVFTILTGLTGQSDLDAIWASNSPGKGPGFTLCTSFLSVVVTRICLEGHISRPSFSPTVNWIGQNYPGRVSGARASDLAREGDFFQTFGPKGFKHCGVIMGIMDGQWSVAAGGCGSFRDGKDGIEWSPFAPIPDQLSAILNVDEYFPAWKGQDIQFLPSH